MFRISVGSERVFERDLLTSLSARLSPQKYLHESRHRHAMQRKRGDGGRFFSPKEKEEMALAMQVRALRGGLKQEEGFRGVDLNSHWPPASAPPLG